MNLKPNMRCFHLERLRDVSGISGTGRVAEGVVFSDGSAVVRWLTAVSSTCVYESIDAVKAIHGHGTATRVVFAKRSRG